LALDQNGRRFQSEQSALPAVYFSGERDASLKIPVIEELAAGDAHHDLVANTYVNYVLDRDMRPGANSTLLSSLVAASPCAASGPRPIRPRSSPCAKPLPGRPAIMDSSPATAGSGVD